MFLGRSLVLIQSAEGTRWEVSQGMASFRAAVDKKLLISVNCYGMFFSDKGPSS